MTRYDEICEREGCRFMYGKAAPITLEMLKYIAVRQTVAEVGSKIRTAKVMKIGRHRLQDILDKKGVKRVE
jgi:hypothetical protein